MSQVKAASSTTIKPRSTAATTAKAKNALAVAYAINYMRDHLGEELTIDDLHAVAGYSRFHFTRVFEQMMGLSPMRYLAALRMERAKWLLEHTDHVVSVVSVTVGYSSAGTFGSLFKKRVGTSPAEYRKLIRCEQPPGPAD